MKKLMLSLPLLLILAASLVGAVSAAKHPNPNVTEIKTSTRG